MKEQYKLDDKLSRQCIEANNHNNLTACYHLLIKKKKLQGEDLNEYDICTALSSLREKEDDVDEIAIII